MASAIASEPMAPTLLRGLTILGPVDTPDPDLALEFGLSAWMFETRTEVWEVMDLLGALRGAVLDAAGMDVAREPIPFVGRSPREDVLSSVSYLGALVERAASVARCTSRELAERAIKRLSETSPHLVDEVREDAPVLATIIPLRAAARSAAARSS